MMLRPGRNVDRQLDVTYEGVAERVSRMFSPESEPYEHHRLRGHATLENEPHLNSFEDQTDVATRSRRRRFRHQ